jgi:hypothetical protein
MLICQIWFDSEKLRNENNIVELMLFFLCIDMQCSGELLKIDSINYVIVFTLCSD